MGQDLPIILLSGMATDERLFEAQLAAFPTLRVQRWIEPLRGESLSHYAARLAPHLDPKCPCIIGGASFGGAVALELATHLPAVACILIGSIRSPKSLPLRWRLLRPLALLGPDVLQKLAAFAAQFGRISLSKSTVRQLRRLASPEAAFVRWAMCAVVNWRPSPATQKLRVFHIHGGADDVLPAVLGTPNVVVPGGRHALTVFNPSAVNEFIADVLKELDKK